MNHNIQQVLLKSLRNLPQTRHFDQINIKIFRFIQDDDKTVIKIKFAKFSGSLKTQYPINKHNKLPERFFPFRQLVRLSN